MYNNTLNHYGVKGMKWGVRKAAAKVYRMNEKVYKKRNKTLANANAQAAKRMETIADNIKKGDLTTTKSSKITNKVLNDYANMDDKTFRQKYQASKRVFAKRVEKHGDPYIYATTGKKLVGDAYEKNKSRLVAEVTTNTTTYKNTFSNGKIVVNELMKTDKGRTFKYARLTDVDNNESYDFDDIEYAHQVARDYRLV